MTKLEKFAIHIAKRSGQKLISEFRKKDASLRGTGKGIKTLYDKLSDEIIKKAIEKNFPDHSYLTEETGLVDKKSDYLWIIDPLDGTSNFVNHNPFFSVSIALWHNHKPILGVIEAPMLKERFVAFSGKGAYIYDLLRNKRKPAQVSSVNKIKDSYWVFCEGGEKNQKRIAKIFSYVYPQVKEFRKIGSAALELAMVGSGRADGYITTKIRFWDIAAGIIFVKEAGGEILKFKRQSYSWKEFLNSNNFNLMACNGKVKFNLSEF